MKWSRHSCWTGGTVDQFQQTIKIFFGLFHLLAFLESGPFSLRDLDLQSDFSFTLTHHENIPEGLSKILQFTDFKISKATSKKAITKVWFSEGTEPTLFSQWRK